MQAAPAIDPGFSQRRVKRPNPMQKWDAETQKKIQEDFDALLRDLVAEHKDAESRELDNQHASALHAKFKSDEEHGRKLLKSRVGPVSFLKGAFQLGRSRFAQFCLGHEVLHGSYSTHPDPQFQGREGWYMPLFILDKHIEHHLFPFLSSRKLDEASDRVRALCEKYELPYTEGSLGKILYEGLKVDLKVVFAA